MRGIRPPALFELRALVNACKGWRNAVDLRHTLVSRSALVSTEARLARPVDIPNWLADSMLNRAKTGPHGRSGLPKSCDSVSSTEAQDDGDLLAERISPE